MCVLSIAGSRLRRGGGQQTEWRGQHACLWAVTGQKHRVVTEEEEGKIWDTSKNRRWRKIKRKDWKGTTECSVLKKKIPRTCAPRHARINLSIQKTLI